MNTATTPDRRTDLFVLFHRIGTTLRLLPLLVLGLIVGLLNADQFGDFTYTNNGTHITITGYTGSGGDVEIPNTIAGLAVTKIGNSSFYFHFMITSISIPSSVTHIGTYAFSYTGIASVDFPDSVVFISNYALSGCYNLVGVTIGSSVGLLQEAVFQDCPVLDSITVDEDNSNMSSLNGVLFNKYQTKILKYPQGKVGSYVIPNGVSQIGWAAFSKCAGLTSVVIPDTVSTIESYAFYECSGLASLDLGTGVSTVGWYAFYQCSALAGLVIPESVTRIEEYTFYGCVSLSSMVIPNGVSFIGNSAFRLCSNLTEAIFEGNAPLSFGTNVFLSAAPSFTVFFNQGATDFTTPTWQGYPSSMLSTVPEPPVILGITRNDNGSMTMTWTAPAGVTDPQELDDFVQRSPTVGGWQSITSPNLTINAGVVSFTDSSPLPGKGFYRVARP